MFSGIVEEFATVVAIEKDRENVDFTLTCSFVKELKIDQSVAHNGVCLTVVRILDKDGKVVEPKSDAAYAYVVTAMKETLDRSNLGDLQVGTAVNVERSMLMNGRLDGHIVQGHVDQKAVCIEAKETDGSWYYRFEYDTTREMIERGYFCVDKGSVTINGVSLTVCEPDIQGNKGYVSVCIIPYTEENTNFKYIKEGTVVNIEFDILGKYMARYLSQMSQMNK